MPAVEFTPSTEEDLDVIWKKIIDECQNITNWNLNDKKVLKVDDVIARIRPRKHDNESKVKDVFQRTLSCIERVGQVSLATFLVGRVASVNANFFPGIWSEPHVFQCRGFRHQCCARLFRGL